MQIVLHSILPAFVGPSKLPELGKGLGKTVKNFQSAAKVRGMAAGWAAQQQRLYIGQHGM